MSGAPDQGAPASVHRSYGLTGRMERESSVNNCVLVRSVVSALNAKTRAKRVLKKGVGVVGHRNSTHKPTKAVTSSNAASIGLRTSGLSPPDMKNVDISF
jgi:hypothetical protein